MPAPALGRQRALQKRVTHEESVSSNLLENGLRLADSRQLLLDESEFLEDRRRAFLEEMTGLVSRLRFLASLADGRRLGLDLDSSSPGYLPVI